MLRNNRNATGIYFVLAILLVFNGCTRDAGTLESAPYPSDAEIFIDGFGPGVTYQAFGNSKVDALGIDESDTYSGSSALTITVPAEGDPDGWFAGGAFVAPDGRDLSGFDALTFWAKASQSATVDLMGFGNDNTGNSKYPTELHGLKMTRGWKKFIVPIPLPEKLQIEGGLFYFADGHDNGAGYDIWVDELKFENLGTLAHPTASIPSLTFNREVGDEFAIEGQGTVTFDNGGENITVYTALGYFTFTSSDNNIATVDEYGAIKAIGLGTATISGKLGSTTTEGKVVVNVNEVVSGPAQAAPNPTKDQADVVSLFSNVYSNVPVDTWSASWDVADLEEIQLMGNDTKLYTNLAFAGIEFTSQTIDASNMTNFYINIWTPDVTAEPALFKIKLVDFGADGAFGGADDVEHEITLTANTSPTLTSKTWLEVDIPLSDFVGLTSTGHIAQMIISGDPNTLYVDNVYFYGNGGGNVATEPKEAAPDPTQDEANVVSIFSDSYTDIDGTDFNPSWGQTTVVTTEDISGNNMLKYANLNFQGTQFGNEQDVSAMTYLHIDMWTNDATVVKATPISGTTGENLVDLKPIIAEQWNSYDIPLTTFIDGGVSMRDLIQLKFDGQEGVTPSNIYLDNIYFYSDGGNAATEPTMPAPIPTYVTDDVTSLFSNAYTNVNVDAWSTDWDDTDIEDTQIAGDDVKLYTNLTFAGIEFTSQTIDASAMTHFTMDIWTPDATADSAIFKIKLVDFGANGVWEESGDNVEHELTLSATTTPALATGSWVTLDIPLSDFTGLTTTAHLAQMIISGDLTTVYMDNVLLHK